jgi:hypothetical protein
VAHPQLAYALFQALILNKIVDPAIHQVRHFSGLALSAEDLPSERTAPPHTVRHQRVCASDHADDPQLPQALHITRRSQARKLP